MSKSKYLFLVLVFLSLYSCKENEFKGKSKEIKPVHIVRFDVDLKEMNASNFQSINQKLWQNHPDIYPFYCRDLMGVRGFSKEMSGNMGDMMIPFLAGEYAALYDSCDKIYHDISPVETELQDAFEHYAFHFPKRKTPVVYSMIISPNHYDVSAFNYGTDTIGINLFRYMGENFSFYEGLYDKYWHKWQTKEYISRNVMLVLFQAHQNEDRRNLELIYEMIEAGKKLYYLDAMIPEKEDHIKIGYSEKQLEWCIKNETEIWKFFVENKLLYSLDNMDYKRMIQEGPTTAGMPAESPGMVGAWVGWQIVRKYMKDHPKSLEELIYKTDPKKILKEAGYKPQ